MKNKKFISSRKGWVTRRNNLREQRRREERNGKLGAIVIIIGMLVFTGVIAQKVSADFNKSIDNPTIYEEMDDRFDVIDIQIPTTYPSREDYDAVEAVEAVDSPQPLPPIDIEQLIRETFPETPNTAVAIAKCENDYWGNGYKWNPEIIGDKGTLYHSVGIFQIRELPNRMTFYNLTREMLQEPGTNIEMARKIYERSGWSPWTCYTANLYQKYL